MTLISSKCLADSQAPQDVKIDAAIAKNATQDTAIAALQLAQLAGAAQTVPAAGVQSGTLPAGVTTTPASVVGFDAAALAAIPLSTDTIVGKSRSATPLETGAGVLNDGVHVSPADLLAAARTANTFAAAIAINPNKYGTFASVAAPTLAPTEANPQTILTNGNGEVFAYTGTKWVLIANGLLIDKQLPASVPLTQSAFTVICSITAPRSGYVEINGSSYVTNNQPFVNSCDSVYGLLSVNGSIVRRIGGLTTATNSISVLEINGNYSTYVNKDDVVSLVIGLGQVFNGASLVAGGGLTGLQLKYTS